MDIPSNWVNVTAITKAYGKKFNNFYRLKSTKFLLDSLEEKYGSPQLIIVQGGIPEKQGSWASNEIAEAVLRWASFPKGERNERFEAHHREKLAKKLNGKTEVSTPVGNCDVVTKIYAIEVKEYRGWKSAIGQAQVYAYYLQKKPAIHLIGNVSPECREVCSYLGVEIIE